MSIFANTLNRLRAAVQHPNAIYGQFKVPVEVKDLRELLHHFDRIDSELRRQATIRDHHFAEMKDRAAQLDRELIAAHVDAAADRARARKDIALLVETLNNHRRNHYVCEDSWYNCPKHPDGSSNEYKENGICNCGADEANAEIDSVLTTISGDK